MNRAVAFGLAGSVGSVLILTSVAAVAFHHVIGPPSAAGIAAVSK